MMTLHQKPYASIASYQPTNQPHDYGEFFQYQCVDAVQGDDVARVAFLIKKGPLKNEEESTSLASLTALYDFSNSARIFSYP